MGFASTGTGPNQQVVDLGIHFDEHGLPSYLTENEKADRLHKQRQHKQAMREFEVKLRQRFPGKEQAARIALRQQRIAAGEVDSDEGEDDDDLQDYGIHFQIRIGTDFLDPRKDVRPDKG